MVFADHFIWHAWGETTIWFAAVVTAIGLLSRTRPVKWLYRHLVGEPVTEWGERVVSQVVETKISTNNGGSSLKDKIDSVERLASGSAGEQKDMKASLDQLTKYAEEIVEQVNGSRQRLRQLYRAVDIPIFESNPHGWCTYVNPAYADLVGLSVQDSLGEGWFLAVHPEDRERVASSWGRAVEIGEEFTSVYRFRNVTTGVEVEVRGSASPLHDAHRKVTGWVGTIDVLSDPND